MRLLTWAVVMVWVWLCAPGCGPAEAERERPRPYAAVATVGMVRDIVTNVAGDQAKVTSLLGPGVDPHLYKPTRDDVARLIRADVIFYNGHHLEGKMVDVLEKIGRKKPAYAVAEQIDAERLISTGGEADPHVWMDVSAWADVTDVVTKTLAEFDPDYASEYRQRGEAYRAELMRLHEYGQRVMASIPERGRFLISSHDAFTYFGKAYDIRVLGVQGLNTESEAGLRRINQLVDLIVKNEVKAVFVESSVPRKSIEALIAGVRSRGGTLEIGGELFTDAMGEDGSYEGTYIGMMDHNLTTVARALGGEAPEGGMAGRLTHGRH